MAAAMLTSSFVAKAACRPSSSRLTASNGSRVVMKAGNWCVLAVSISFFEICCYYLKGGATEA